MMLIPQKVCHSSGSLFVLVNKSLLFSLLYVLHVDCYYSSFLLILNYLCTISKVLCRYFYPRYSASA